jgi:hypothetical protein
MSDLSGSTPLRSPAYQKIGSPVAGIADLAMIHRGSGRTDFSLTFRRGGWR